MKDLPILLAHLLSTIAKLLEPGGSRAVVADSLHMKQQRLLINRRYFRAMIGTPTGTVILDTISYE